MIGVLPGLVLLTACLCSPRPSAELPATSEPVVPEVLAPPPTTDVPVIDEIPERYPTGTVGDFLGINEGVAVPERRYREMGSNQVKATLEEDARIARLVGAQWVRVNSAAWPFFSFFTASRETALERMDKQVSVVQASGLDMIVVLGPWPGNQTANYTEHYLPDDMEAYGEWVRQTVERYDGDGVDDMPGLLRPIRHWEVDNEPDLHNSSPPRGAKREQDPTTFETPDEYAQVFLASATAIKTADPTALVISGGIFRPATDGKEYLSKVLAVRGVRENLDAISIHVYFDCDSPDVVDAAFDNALALADGKPVIVTEAGVPSDMDGKRRIDEEYQARMVALVVGEALTRGLERVFWHTLADPPGEIRNNSFSTHSLHRTMEVNGVTTLERKPSGDVYSRIVTILGSVPMIEVEGSSCDGGRAVRVGGSWLVYEGKSVQCQWTGTRVTDLITGTDSALGEKVKAPAVVRP